MPIDIPFQGPLKVGDRVPDFTLKAAGKTEVRDFTLSQELGAKDVVFSFFPIAFTRVCTIQMCEMRDRALDLASLDAKVYGFSGDTSWANREFAKQQNLEHAILSDPNFEVLPRIWALQRVAGVDNRAKRGVMVVGGDGVVKWVHVHDNSGEWIGLDEIRKHVGTP